ncbi:MAG: glucosaminidase domain-containing protein [Clostridia bacterium]|nr:glucosaminidase domain-containing protein [Clostridia bacterium]
MGSLKALMATVLTAIKSVLPKVAITATAIVATTGTIYYYTIDDASYVAGDTSNVPYVVNQEIDKIVEELNNEENLHNYLAILHENEYYIANLEEMVKNIIKELDKNDAVLPEYISKSHLEEYLKDFIKAELVTVYPDLRADKNAIGKDSRDTRLQGHIKIVRYSQGNEKTLTYVPRSEFTELINNYNSGGNEKFKEHFTINENGDLVIGGWTSSTSSAGTIESAYETTISYKQQIQNYTMPFNFLWGLLVMTEDEEFVHNLAELAIDTQITIGIYDNISITEEISVKKYITQEVTEYFPGPGSNYEVIDNEYEGRQTTRNSITQSNTTIALQYAKTWIAEYEKKFEYVENENEIPSDWEDTAYWTSLSDEVISENYTRDHELAYTKKVRNVNVQTANTSATSTYSYNCINGSGEIKELTDIDKYKKKNFVYYLRRSETALKYLTDSPEWMYEVLLSSEKTSNMVDLFKYLLYKTTGKNYGVTDISSFLNNLTNMFGNFTSLGNDFIVQTDMMPEIVLDKDTILQTIEKQYSGQKRDNLTSVIDSLMKIQEENKVNAVFAIAVSIIESGAGTGWDLIDSSTYNMFSMQSWQGSKTSVYTDRNGTNWCGYDSFSHAVTDFGLYISTHSAYFKAGNYSVKTIAPIYCGNAWGESVVKEMKTFLEAAGVNTTSILSQYNYVAGSSSLLGNSVQDNVWYALKQCGFSNIAIAGVMGNIECESEFIPGITEQGNSKEGIGLVQWTFYTRKNGLIDYAASKGLTWQDLNTQIEYLITEINRGEGPASAYVKVCDIWTESQRSRWINAKTVEEATTIFCDYFEKPGVRAIEKRINAAKKYFEEYKNKTLFTAKAGRGWTPSSNNQIHGSFNVNGKTFYVPIQGRVGWPNECNRATALTIMSGLAGKDEAGTLAGVNELNNFYSRGGYNYILSDARTTRDYFAQIGYSTNVISVNGRDYRNDLKSVLTRGGVAAMWVDVSSYGKTGTVNWTTSIHWVGVLAYDASTDKIFVTDPSSRNNNGWYSMNEFMKGSNSSNIGYVTQIYK